MAYARWFISGHHVANIRLFTTVKVANNAVSLKLSLIIRILIKKTVALLYVDIRNPRMFPLVPKTLLWFVFASVSKVH